MGELPLTVNAMSKELLALLLNQNNETLPEKERTQRKNCLLVVVAFASPPEFYVYSPFTYLEIFHINRNHYCFAPSFGSLPLLRKDIFPSEAKDICQILQQEFKKG